MKFHHLSKPFNCILSKPLDLYIFIFSIPNKTTIIDTHYAKPVYTQLKTFLRFSWLDLLCKSISLYINLNSLFIFVLKASLGGVAQLFLGLSFLSIADLLYHFTLGLYCKLKRHRDEGRYLHWRVHNLKYRGRKFNIMKRKKGNQMWQKRNEIFTTHM